MDNHVFAGVREGREEGGGGGGWGEPAKRGWDLKGTVRYFSFKGSERYSEIIRSTGQLGLQPDYLDGLPPHIVLSFRRRTRDCDSTLCRTLRIALFGTFFPPEDALARNLEHERVATCNTSPNRLSYDALRYPLRLAVPAILGARITYRLVARAFSRKGSSLALLLTKCPAAFVPRSYNLRGALDVFLDERGFWSFRGRNIENVFMQLPESLESRDTINTLIY